MTIALAVDTSALVAIIRDEDEADWLCRALHAADERLMSAGSVQEYLVVVADQARKDGKDPNEARAAASSLIEALNVRVLPVTSSLALTGSIGVMRYRRPPAKLNFGDGFSYALAKSRAIPLLCIGNDFPHTDIEVLQPPAA